jgi:tetratricopeptide (TPR) repeat protein
MFPVGPRDDEHGHHGAELHDDRARLGSRRVRRGDDRGGLLLQRGLAAKRGLLLLAVSLLAACATARREAAPLSESELPPGAEAWSLFGEPLSVPPLDAETKRDREARLAEATARLQAEPENPDAFVWAGRRTAYLGRYRDAIALFTAGIAKFPNEPELYRHRGHRYVSVRRFDAAAADLETAARLIAGTPDEVEPDGLPNARNVPTGTLHSNTWYHLGLARYLTGDFERALDAYRKGLAVSKNPDMLVATSHWLYMTLRRLGREAEAAAVLEPIRAGMDVIENHEYHRLLLLYRGDLAPETLLSEAADSGNPVAFATVGYGVGNWHLYNGKRPRAVELFRRVIAGGSWASFGYIAAEAELARMGIRPK